MDLENIIDSRIWESIRSNYENRDHTGSIQDAIHFLSDLLREKAGVEGDGVALVGQALGGKIPRLKLTKLQSETDLSIQAGIEQIVRGIYQAIRNPRSHEKYNDNKADADAIIYFLDFIIKIIDRSKSPFTKNEFLKRVFDRDFVEKDRHASILVNEIPKKQRLDIFIEAYRAKERGQGKKLAYFFKALFRRLAKEEKKQVCAVISEELKHTDDVDAIRVIIQILPRSCWMKYDEAARLRIENKLIQSVREGRYDRATERCPAGALGTWAHGLYKYFRLKSDLLNVVTTKLESDDKEEQDYVFTYFFYALATLSPKPNWTLRRVITRGLEAGDIRFRHALTPIIYDTEWEEWKKAFNESYEKFKPAEQAATRPSVDDDIPF